jgi:glyoxylase-like metal-dependent hydrolase (beta-lactamase superfamily II)
MTTIALSMTRLYLLQGSDGRYTLIDTGYEHEWERFLRQLHRRGIDPGNIVRLFLTHHHDDHAGFAARLLREHPAITVVARAEAEPLLAAGRNNTANGGSLLNRRIRALFELKRKLSPDWNLSFPPVALRPHDLRLDAERTDLSGVLGFEAEALYTPGHSSDSQSLLLPDGSLFCGDMAARFLDFAGARHCTLFNEDIEGVYRSWRRVLELGAGRIYPAHGRSFDAERLKRHMGAHSPDSVVHFPGL